MSCRDSGAVGGFHRTPCRKEPRAHRNYCVPIPRVSSLVAVVTGVSRAHAVNIGR